MEFTLGLAQVRHREDGDVCAQVEEYAKQAKAKGVDLLVFPESMMTSYELPVSDFIASAQPLDGPYATALNAIAAKYGLWMVYTINERAPKADEGQKPFNTAVVVDCTGTVAGAYRKAHLFDTDFTRESDKMSSGSCLFTPVKTPFCTLGLGICYDLRFPEVARFAALHGADVLVYPAAWVDGKLKAHQWQSLLCARAIENQLFVAGVSRADDRYIGQSCIFGPQGVCLAAAGPEPALLVQTVRTDELAPVRAAMPVLDHRRPELYVS